MLHYDQLIVKERNLADIRLCLLSARTDVRILIWLSSYQETGPQNAAGISFRDWSLIKGLGGGGAKWHELGE